MRFYLLLSLALGGLVFAGCNSFVADVHPDSSGWEDVFNRDLSNAECKKPGWHWDAEGYLTPDTNETLFTKKDCAPTCVNSAPANEINRMTIVARGKDVTVALNGKIALQGVHGGAPVRFRYLKVKELG